MEYEIQNMKYEVWSMTYEIWVSIYWNTLKYEVCPNYAWSPLQSESQCESDFSCDFKPRLFLSLYIYTHIHVCIYFLRHVYGIKYILMQHSSKILTCRAKQFLRSRRVPHLGWKIPFVLCRSIPQYLLINFDLFYAKSVETQLSSC